ncbi:bifunctional shikimate kinase/3-dehydroquinate synthase [Conexibacter sp. S30A1]|uniref:bifunctional shikimate kinase/3-dehydroquinate synthase n=1 Tax=Conexibacter sp. S30A1 TaxID=2937800 RepID=UPI0020103172|nr:bifunctional shikimate kinase/3-dehydroquinate synthase [Conexibacter sp. S30A1]
MSGQGTEPEAMKIVLVGHMGAGKTTAVKALGGVDVDELIESREQRTVAEIFAADGEGAFRDLEERVTLELLADPSVQAVALGGGALASRRTRAALTAARVVWLDVDADEAWRRVARSPTRPLARDERRFRALHAERQEQYAQAADAIVPASHVRRLAAPIAALEGMPAGAKLIWAVTASADYPAYIGAGLITDRRFWPATIAGRRVLVSDRNAASHYGALFEPVLTAVRIAPGEQSKTLTQAEVIWREMARTGVTRTDVTVALGGGVVGDLAGFCAATYQRGMPVVQVPTTLVAQVDSAYGGKTGVDIPEGKNYVGSFHQPAAVIADTTTLGTLPPAELAAGYAEVVKTGLIAGGWLWRRIAAGAAPDDPDVIAGCALTKLRIVAQDELDTGVRQLLNVGHTVAHAVETVTGYARYRHGEAVALGLLAELRLAGADALRQQVLELLEQAGLPVTLAADVDVEQVLLATTRDKKRVGEGPVPFALCIEPGRALTGQPVAPAELRAAIMELVG